MFFSAAGVECSPFLPPLAAFLVSCITSIGGISGAFLLLPFQVMVLGYTNPSVSATNQFYNVVATPGGVWRFYREGRLLWPLAKIAILGSLPGVFVGAYIRLNWLADTQNFKFFAVAVLLYLAWRMAKDMRKTSAKESMAQGASAKVLEENLRQVRFGFMEKEYCFSVPVVFCITMAVGLVGGIYGIGGGALMAPFLVSSLGLPVYVVAGATLLCTLATSVGGVLFYTLLAPWYPDLSVAPDWLLGLLFGMGGLLGMSVGATLQKYLPARPIKFLLVLLLAFTGFSWLWRG